MKKLFTAVCLLSMGLTVQASAGWETIIKQTKTGEKVEARVLTPEVLKDCEFRLRGVYDKVEEINKGAKVTLQGDGYTRISFVDVSPGCCGDQEMTARVILIRPDNSISFASSFAKNASELELSMKCD